MVQIVVYLPRPRSWNFLFCFLDFFDHCSFCFVVHSNCIHTMRKVVFFSCICALVLQSCNLTRTITTKSECIQRGDTSVVIQTKTVETYDASRKP